MEKSIFDSLPVNERRIIIAKDVIARLEAETFKAKHGNFIKNKYDNYGGIINKEMINSEVCHVCAKGGVFAAWVGLFNNFECELNNIANNYNMRKTPSYYYPDGFLDVFNRDIMDRMEAAFEGYYSKSYAWHDKDNVQAFYNMFPFSEDHTPNERLKAIMNYLINNNGEFPEPKNS